MIIVIMGVSGSGKSTIGAQLAQALQCLFVDSDDYHPAANLAKMHQGIALTDADRQPWLEAVHRLMLDAAGAGRDLVVACSALKQAYRDTLCAGMTIHWVYLSGTPELIAARLLHRTGHFMKAELLGTQFATLEAPEGAIRIDISGTPDRIVEQIRQSLQLQ